MQNNKKTSVILHGHFYQPPRENPRTGIIPVQPSAYPFLDWNEKIYDCCYEANLKSRYLDENGRVLSISNNYEYISFNFGPTLLHWLDNNHPELIEGLREADKHSIERLGHGNAMAQAFNHTILPLDNPENAKLQIEWGIEDFIYHFKREPEGMWLPECGVNDSVVEMLSESGIKFIVLSPWQANSVEKDDGKIYSLGSSPCPYSEPYILTGSNGSTITAFFYEPNLASSISFGHALRNADTLYSTLLSIKSTNTPLIHTATDGEIYGHHEPFGDMALAALIRKINERDDFVLTNYASYMMANKATKRAFLKKGEDNKGTSWSCSHGVSRWYKDCGCHTGGEVGWNQKWRTGLRNALNNLGNKIDSIFAEEINSIFSGKEDPYTLLMAAGNVFSGKTRMKEFLTPYVVKYNLDRSVEIKIAHLLTGMKYKHFSFTSCGFFFSDISGLEPRQDIRYALYAISLFQQYSSEELMIPFLSDLKSAKSNIREYSDGALIAQNEIDGLRGEVEACIYFYLNMELAAKEDWKTTYGYFKLKELNKNDSDVEIFLFDSSTDEDFFFKVISNNAIDQGINLLVNKINSKGIKNEVYHITNSSIPARIINESYSWIDRTMVSIDDDTLRKKIRALKLYAILLNHDGSEMDSRLIENLGEALSSARALLYSSGKLDYIARLDNIKDLCYFILEFGRDSEKRVVDDLINQCLEKIAYLVSVNGLTENNSELIIKSLGAIREIGKEPNLKSLQNVLYDYYIHKKETSLDENEKINLFKSLNFH